MATPQSVDLTDVEELTSVLNTFQRGACAEAIAKRVSTMRKAWAEKAVKEIDYQRRFRMSLAVSMLGGAAQGEQAVKTALETVDLLFKHTKDDGAELRLRFPTREARADFAKFILDEHGPEFVFTDDRIVASSPSGWAAPGVGLVNRCDYEMLTIQPKKETA